MSPNGWPRASPRRWRDRGTDQRSAGCRMRKACHCPPMPAPAPPAWTCWPRSATPLTLAPGAACADPHRLVIALPPGHELQVRPRSGPGAEARHRAAQQPGHDRRGLPRRAAGHPDEPRRRSRSLWSAACGSPRRCWRRWCGRRWVIADSLDRHHPRHRRLRQHGHRTTVKVCRFLFAKKTAALLSSSR